MRNFLMAATAIVAVGALATTAHAQMGEMTTSTDSFMPSMGATGNAPEPGTVQINVRFRNWTDVGYGSDSGTNGKTTTGVSNGAKTVNFMVQDYFRIYPTFDATAANGLQYGVRTQIRQNNNGNGTGSANTLYVRNTGGYIGTPTAGRLWFGQVSGALGTFITGMNEDFDLNGGWNGDAPDMLNSNTALDWAWPEDGGTYTQNKIAYISPKFSGFDFGASFEPVWNTAVSQCSQAGAGSTCSYNSTVAGGAQRRKNTFDVGARYTGSFGGTAVVLEGGYWGSGVVGNSTGAQAYSGLSVIDLGAKVVFGQLQLGANWTYGTENGYQPSIKGTAKTNAFIGGAEYTMGTVIVGFHYINEIVPGGYVAATPKNGEHEIGFAAGAAWDYAPGAIAYGTFIWGQKHQSGFDLLNGSAGKYNNSTRAVALAIGNRFAF